MSEHDQALAQGADELVNEFAGVVRDLAVQVQAHEQRLDEQAVALEQVLTTGTAAAEDGGEVLRPWSRATRTPQDWESLCAWVDEMCAVHAVTVLPACWLAHEGLVCELAALRDAWLAAQHTRPDAELMSWYTYYWYPFIGRLEVRDRCRQQHQVDPVATTTDRGLLPDLPTA